jgi:hypothetical protein
LLDEANKAVDTKIIERLDTIIRFIRSSSSLRIKDAETLITPGDSIDPKKCIFDASLDPQDQQPKTLKLLKVV